MEDHYVAVRDQLVEDILSWKPKGERQQEVEEEEEMHIADETFSRLPGWFAEYARGERR